MIEKHNKNMEPTTSVQDIFEIKCLLNDISIKLCAGIENGIKQLLALVTRYCPNIVFSNIINKFTFKLVMVMLYYITTMVNYLLSSKEYHGLLINPKLYKLFALIQQQAGFWLFVSWFFYKKWQFPN